MINKKKSKKRFIIIPIVIIAVVAIALSVNKKSTNPAASYVGETVKKGDIITYYSFSGNIETKNEKQVVADKMIKINKIHVSEGDIVNSGDLIYTIDISDGTASLKQAAAAVELARVNYENAKNGLADQQLNQLDSAVSSAKLAYDDAVKNLERVTALFDEGGIAEQSLE
ncbi:MAG: efflux RND transporter periplasmic adaptor subunit, partial [Tissierellia bacterium]|nr:efflux RND transporter periplasmic adaptor subunit [Tissierellia bacterium]